jgi:hypothetical protein
MRRLNKMEPLVEDMLSKVSKVFFDKDYEDCSEVQQEFTQQQFRMDTRAMQRVVEKLDNGWALDSNGLLEGKKDE